MPINILGAFETEPPPLDFVFCGLLSGTVGALVSPGATGKSFFAMETAIAIACTDADMLRIDPAKQGKVAYLSLEDPGIITQRRLHEIGKKLSNNVRVQVAENLRISELMGSRLNVMNEKTAVKIAESCMDVRLIIVDTLSRIHTLEENDNGEMSQLVSQFEWLAKQTGAAVLYLHHMNKGSGRDGVGDQQSSRGASALVDNARWVGTLTKMTTMESEALSNERMDHRSVAAIDKEDRHQFVKFSQPKVNYSAPESDRWFVRGQGGVLRPTIMSTATEKKDDNKDGKTKKSGPSARRSSDV